MCLQIVLTLWVAGELLTAATLLWPAPQPGFFPLEMGFLSSGTGTALGTDVLLHVLNMHSCPTQFLFKPFPLMSKIRCWCSGRFLTLLFPIFPAGQHRREDVLQGPLQVLRTERGQRCARPYRAKGRSLHLGMRGPCAREPAGDVQVMWLQWVMLMGRSAPFTLSPFEN